MSAQTFSMMLRSGLSDLQLPIALALVASATYVHKTGVCPSCRVLLTQFLLPSDFFPMAVLPLMKLMSLVI